MAVWCPFLRCIRSSSAPPLSNHPKVAFTTSSLPASLGHRVGFASHPRKLPETMIVNGDLYMVEQSARSPLRGFPSRLFELPSNSVDSTCMRLCILSSLLAASISSFGSLSRHSECVHSNHGQSSRHEFSTPSNSFSPFQDNIEMYKSNNFEPKTGRSDREVRAATALFTRSLSIRMAADVVMSTEDFP